MYLDYEEDIYQSGFCLYLDKGDRELNSEINNKTIIQYSEDKELIGKTAAEVFGEFYPASLL